MSGPTQPDENSVPQIFVPSETVTAVAPDGKHMLFFTVPELDVMIKRVLADRPPEFTYRWAYHPGQKVHVLLFAWPNGEGAGIAIPEGVGDTVLNFILESTDVFITTLPVLKPLHGAVSYETIRAIVTGNTVSLPNVKFEKQA